MVLLRLVPVAMLSAMMWVGGVPLSLVAMAGFWLGRTATLAVACSRRIQ
jgi:hypothetical protein